MYQHNIIKNPAIAGFFCLSKFMKTLTFRLIDLRVIIFLNSIIRVLKIKTFMKNFKHSIKSATINLTKSRTFKSIMKYALFKVVDLLII